MGSVFFKSILQYPCTAMVFVWSTLTIGNPAYTVVQVATNTVGVLTEVPVMLFLVKIANQTKGWFRETSK